MTRWWAALIALAGAVILAIVATTPPAPVSADAPATAFSAARAMGDVYAVGGALCATALLLPHVRAPAAIVAVEFEVVSKSYVNGVVPSETFTLST